MIENNLPDTSKFEQQQQNISKRNQIQQEEVQGLKNIDIPQQKSCNVNLKQRKIIQQKQRQVRIRKKVQKLIFTPSLYIFVLILVLLFNDQIAIKQNGNQDTFNNFILQFQYIPLFMYYWSLIQTMFTCPGYVPQNQVIPYEKQQLLRLQNTNKICIKCRGIDKVEKSHHCSQCFRCILNLDHHCDMMQQCIGLFNRKFFILTYFYGFITNSLGFLYIIININTQYSNIINKESILASIWVMFLILIILILEIKLLNEVKLHIKNVINCVTVLDNKKNIIKNLVYNRGTKQNIQFYFGKNYITWFFPVGKPLGDGYNWDIIKNYSIINNDDQNTTVKLD